MTNAQYAAFLNAVKENMDNAPVNFVSWYDAQGNIANYDAGAGWGWNGQFGNVTTVGSGGPGSASFYGAFDMGGNLMAWNEEEIFAGRGRRGGHWNFGGGSFLRSTDRRGIVSVRKLLFQP